MTFDTRGLSCNMCGKDIITKDGLSYFVREGMEHHFCRTCSRKVNISGDDRDMLVEIVEKQKEIDDRIEKMSDKIPEGKRERINSILLAVIAESNEARNELGFIGETAEKYWKNIDGDDTDWDEFREELIDILHFLISAMIKSGMEPEDIYDEYMDKNRKNHERQDEWSGED